MAEWKKEIKELARGFCLSQVIVNRLIKRFENMYEQREREIPDFYKGNREEFLYDKVQSEIMNIVFA